MLTLVDKFRSRVGEKSEFFYTKGKGIMELYQGFFLYIL